MKTKIESDRFFQFRISLVGRDTEYLCDIWRRIVVPKTVLLPELHYILQGAMGWENRHLHEFRIGSRTYTIPDDDDPVETLLDDNLDERHFVLSQVIHGMQEFFYLYDFGDRWEHSVEVEDVGLIPEQVAITRFPACIGGQGACPPEDCGGPLGYANLLQALIDPDHHEHEQQLRCYGPRDPYAFNSVQATLLIHANCALYRIS